GYNWDVFPRRKFFSFAGPTGDIGSFEFLYSGEGRLFYLPSDGSDAGPFWNEEDPKKPSVGATKLFTEGRELRSFDLSGRLLSEADPATGNRMFYLYEGNRASFKIDQIAAGSWT